MPKPCNIGNSPDHLYGFAGLTTHIVVRLTLRCGLQFAFDPTAAQYGWREVLSPWESYKTHRMRLIVSASTLVLGETNLNGPIVPPRCSHLSPQVRRRRKALVIALTMTIILAAQGVMFPGSQRTDLRTMFCQLTDDKFEEAIRPILGYAKHTLREGIRRVNEDGPNQKLYWDRASRLCLTDSEQVYDCLKKVWLTEKEYDELEDAGRKALWKSRFNRVMGNMPLGKEDCDC